MRLRDTIASAFDKAFDLLKGTELYDFQTCLNASQERLNQPMQVAVIGEICSSKSTLVNAMLGQKEVVRTGPMEETFNVNWLKYGSSDADVNVFFKRPKGKTEIVRRGNWAAWANRTGQVSMQENVAFIEVEHDSPALKIFNIIDTPGLNAYYGVDSQNTIAFLNQMRPDAVVLVFTKSIAQRAIDVVKGFQGPFLNEMTPVNAVGVLSKIDAYWPNEPDPLLAGQRISERLLNEEFVVKNTLYQLYPVCACLAVGARTLTSKDFNAFQILAKIDKSKFAKMLSTMRRFVAEDKSIPVPPCERKRLSDKFTRYGVLSAVSFVKDNNDATMHKLIDFLLKKSGFDLFYDSLIRHFGNRSYLIKISGLFSDIQKLVDASLKNATVLEASVINRIGNIFTEIALKQHELQEIELLKNFYSGHISLTESEEQDLRNITGENGPSCSQRLGLSNKMTIEELKASARTKSEYWHVKSVRTMLDPRLKNAAKLLEISYRSLIEEIETYKTVLENTSQALWGCTHREKHI